MPLLTLGPRKCGFFSNLLGCKELTPEHAATALWAEFSSQGDYICREESLSWICSSLVTHLSVSFLPGLFNYRQTDLGFQNRLGFVLWANCPDSLPLCPMPFQFSSFKRLICAGAGAGTSEAWGPGQPLCSPRPKSATGTALSRTLKMSHCVWCHFKNFAADQQLRNTVLQGVITLQKFQKATTD